MVDLDRMTRAASCIYIAVDKCVADDISKMLLDAVKEIQTLRKQVEETNGR